MSLREARSGYTLFRERGLPAQAAPPAQPLRVALFDVDGTLVVSASGRLYAEPASDALLLPGAAAALAAYKAAGWTVALVSNQPQQEGSNKVGAVLDAIAAEAGGWAPWALVATEALRRRGAAAYTYRKPERGMYDALLAELGAARPPAEVFMCGDAAGPTDPHPPYRWSDADAGFAAAIGAEFRRPMDEPMLKACTPASATPAPRVHPRELVLLVGAPASGKSTTGRRFAAAGYVHVEQDALGGAAARVLRDARRALVVEQRSTVVDATHATAAARAPYLALAAEAGAACRILWHVAGGRACNAERPRPVPPVAFAVYSKRFEAPTAGEGAEVAVVAPWA